MNILAVDTAGKTVGVALLQDDRLLYECYLDAGMTHSETLMPLIDNCLKLCGMGCKDIDLYRISTENDLCAAGFYDYLDQGAIVAAEWSENFADLLAPEDPIHINIDRVDDTTRRITIEGVSV